MDKITHNTAIHLQGDRSMLVTNLLGQHLLNNEALIAHSRSLLPLSRPQLSRFPAAPLKSPQASENAPSSKPSPT